MVAIVSVVLFETLAGIMVNSLVILSDAAHATFDAITTLILLVTTGWALKPPDEDHTYGHGKIESMGGLAGGMALVAIAAFLMYESGSRLVFGGISARLEVVGFIAIGYTLCVDFFRVGTLSRIVDKGSVTVKANLYHAFGDMASTIVALLGFYFATVVGLSQGDAIGSLILSIFLVYLSLGLMRTSGMELSDTISRKVITELRRRVVSAHGVLECKEVKARKVGEKYFVDTTVVVPEHVGIQEAHETATRIESNIAGLLTDAMVTVHVEPSVREASLESKVEDLAATVKGVKEVHNVSISYAGGNLYLTLHAQVDGKLPIEEAHKIAERIEQNLRREVNSTAKITIHLEPFDHLKIGRKSPRVEEKLEETMKELIGKHPEVLKVKSVATHVGGEYRYINIDLTFSRRYSVEEAHHTASDIERELRKRFDKAIVTIHSEPEPND